MYFTPSPDIADNIEELSEIHSFYEQVHSMNENTGNLGDITDEVEMAEKFHNQIPPPRPHSRSSRLTSLMFSKSTAVVIQFIMIVTM